MHKKKQKAVAKKSVAGRKGRAASKARKVSSKQGLLEKALGKGSPLSKQAQMEIVDNLFTIMAKEIIKANAAGRPVSKSLDAIEAFIERQRLGVSEERVAQQRERLKIMKRKLVLFERAQKAEKNQKTGGPITKEGWEQIERDLKLI